MTDNDGNNLGEASSISADGKTITGYTVDGLGFIWKEGEGAITYNHFADAEFPEDYWTTVSSISDDGKTAVGFSFSFFEGMLFGKSFIWTEEGGFKDLGEYVDELGYDNLGLQFSLAIAISPDIQYIGGIGANFDLGDAIGFVIKRPGQMGTNDQTLATSLSIYPNPVKETLNFKSSEKIDSIEIFNMLGQKVANGQLNNNSFNVANLVKGVYVVKVKTETVVKTLKFIKQ